MARRKSELLTEVELEFMKVLWAMGRGTVRDVFDELAKGTPRAYTSVATTLKVLESKGYLVSTKAERTLTYAPTQTRNDYEMTSIRQMSNALFDGTPSALVARLVEDEELSDEAIAEILEIIDRKVGRDGT